MKKLMLIASILFVSACSQAHNAPAPEPVPVPAPAPAPAPTPAPAPATQTLLQKMIANGVPSAAATEAMAKYELFKDQVTNKAWLTVVDFSKHSGKKRMFMVNTADGSVDAILVAHGAGSDPGATGTPTKFSNINGSHMSSLGAYILKDKFMFANHGESLHLKGLEITNNLAGPRAIYVHPATYVSTSLSKMGMSWGCFAVSPLDAKRVMPRLMNGTFLYAYSTVKSIGVKDATSGAPMVDESAAPVEGLW